MRVERSALEDALIIGVPNVKLFDFVQGSNLSFTGDSGFFGNAARYVYMHGAIVLYTLVGTQSFIVTRLAGVVEECMYVLLSSTVTICGNNTSIQY